MEYIQSDVPRDCALCVEAPSTDVWETSEKLAIVVYGTMGEEGGTAVGRKERRVHRIRGLIAYSGILGSKSLWRYTSCFRCA